jgi:hypothetical protein
VAPQSILLANWICLGSAGDIGSRVQSNDDRLTLLVLRTGSGVSEIDEALSGTTYGKAVSIEGIRLRSEEMDPEIGSMSGGLSVRQDVAEMG